MPLRRLISLFEMWVRAEFSDGEPAFMPRRAPILKRAHLCDPGLRSFRYLQPAWHSRFFAQQFPGSARLPSGPMQV